MSKQVNFKIACKKTVDVSNAADAALELFFLDELENTESYDWWTGEETETNMLQDVMDQVRSANPSRITCYIDCVGGDLSIAMGIYNYLKNYNARVECRVISLCLSAATVILSAASKGKRIMPVNGFLMMHKPAIAATGTADDLRQAANVADRYENQVADILSRNNTAGKTADEIKALWANGDCWLTGQEALDMGFVDELYNDMSGDTRITNRAAKVKMLYNKDIAPVSAFAEPEITETLETAETGLHTNTLNEVFMNIKAKAEEFIASFKHISVKNSGNSVSSGTADVTAILQTSVMKFAEDVETEVRNELETFKVSMEEKLSVIDTLREDSAALHEELKRLKSGESNPKVENSGFTFGRFMSK